MGFPHRVYGWYGDEKVAQSTKISGLPLGIKLELPDGREYVHARAGAVALVAGELQQAPVAAGTATTDVLTTQGRLTCASAAVGATTLTITTGGTLAFTKNQFADGYVITASSAGTGIGLVYKIKANNSAAAASATCLFTLYENDKVKVAIEGGTTKVGVRTNEYDKVIVCTSDTVYTGPIAGIPPVAVSADFYCWLQRKGVAPIKSGATVLIAGEPVVASTGDVTGAGHNMAGTAVVNQKSKDRIGFSMATAVSGGFATVYLTLP